MPKQRKAPRAFLPGQRVHVESHSARYEGEIAREADGDFILVRGPEGARMEWLPDVRRPSQEISHAH